MATVAPPLGAVYVDQFWNNNLQVAVLVENYGSLITRGSPSIEIATDAEVIIWSEVVNDSLRETLVGLAGYGSPVNTVTRAEIANILVSAPIHRIRPKPRYKPAPFPVNLVYYSQVSDAWLYLIDDSPASP